MTISFCQQFVEKTNKNSKTIADRAFPDCLSTAPNERDITSLLVALDIDNKDEYLVAVDMTKTFTLSGKGLKRSKDGDDYVLSGASLTYSELLELSKNKDVTWFPNPVDPGAYGRSGNHVARYTTIVVENDDKSLNDQWKQVQWLGALGLPPTSVVYTGGKSLHLYFRLTHDVSSDEYLNAKKALVMLLGADTAVSLVEKSRLPGFHRPNKQYPQQLVYNTASRTDVADIFEAFKAQYNRDITDDLWTEYKLSRSGKSSIAPDKVLYTPDNQLPLVINRELKKQQSELRKQHRLDNPISVDNENYYQACIDAITKIDTDATIEDFINLGFKPKKSYGSYTIGSFSEGGKGTSVKIQSVDGKLLAYSFKGYLTGASSSASYSQLWFERNGFNNLSGAEFFRAVQAICTDHGIHLPAPIARGKSTTKTVPKAAFNTPQGSTKVNTRYLSPDLLKSIPDDTKVVAIKSDWGTGKTTLMREIVNKCVSTGDIYVMLSPLQSLARNNAIKLNIYYKTDYVSGVKHVSMCLHNLYEGSAIGSRLIPLMKQHQGKIHLVFDEAECMRKGLLALDSTLSKNQLSIIDSIGDLGALPGARIWLLDADLSEKTTSFYSDCIRQSSRVDASKEVKTHWIINDYQNRIKTLYKYPLVNSNGKQSNPSVVLKHALEAAKNSPDMVLMATTGQKINVKTGKFSAESIANELRDNGLEDKVLVIDSETTAIEGSLAAGVIEDPSRNLKIAKDKGIKVVIFTLGIFKTGLSIEDIGEDRLFSHVFVCSTGLLSPELVIQSLFRYRNLDAPRYLFVKKTGFNFLAGRSLTPARAISTLNKEQNEKLHSRTIDIAAPNRSSTKIYWLLDQWSNVVIGNNQDMNTYSASVQDLLDDAVENLLEVEEDELGLNRLADPATEIDAELDKIQEDLALVNAIKVTEVRDLTPSEALALIESNKRTREQNQQVNRYILQYITGKKEITVEDVYNGDYDFFTRTRLLHQGMVSLHLLPITDKLEIMKITDGNPLRIASKVRYLKALTVRKLLDLGLRDIIFGDDSITNESTCLCKLIKGLVEGGLLTTATVETKKGLTTHYISDGDLTDLVGYGKTYQSKMKCLKDILKRLGATLVLDKNHTVRSYKVRSDWRDLEGNHSCRVMDIIPSLFTHWTAMELSTVLSHLLGRKIAKEQAMDTLGELTGGQLEDELFAPVKQFIDEQIN